MLKSCMCVDSYPFSLYGLNTGLEFYLNWFAGFPYLTSSNPTLTTNSNFSLFWLTISSISSGTRGLSNPQWSLYSSTLVERLAMTALIFRMLCKPRAVMLSGSETVLVELKEVPAIRSLSLSKVDSDRNSS